MAYEKKTWVVTEPIKRMDMQRIENGIADLDIGQDEIREEVDKKLGAIDSTLSGTSLIVPSDFEEENSNLLMKLGAAAPITTDSAANKIATAIITINETDYAAGDLGTLTGSTGVARGYWDIKNGKVYENTHRYALNVSSFNRDVLTRGQQVPISEEDNIPTENDLKYIDIVFTSSLKFFSDTSEIANIEFANQYTIATTPANKVIMVNNDRSSIRVYDNDFGSTYGDVKTQFTASNLILYFNYEEPQEYTLSSGPVIPTLQPGNTLEVTGSYKTIELSYFSTNTNKYINDKIIYSSAFSSLNEAVTEAATEQKTLIVNSNFEVTSPITINTPIVIEGVNGATIAAKSRFTGGIFNITSGASECTFKNLIFSCSYPEITPFAAADKSTRYNNAICVNAACNLTVTNCKFYDLYNVYISGSTSLGNIEISNNTFDASNGANPYYASFISLKEYNGEDNIICIQDNIFIGQPVAANNAEGFETADNNAGGIILSNLHPFSLDICFNTFRYVGRRGGSDKAHRLCVIDCYYNVDNIKIYDNNFNSCVWNPIRLHGGQNLIIRNNEFSIIEDNVTYEYAILVSCDKGTAQADVPIPVENITIQDNIIKTSDCRPQKIIWLAASATTVGDTSARIDNIKIVGNIIKGSAQYSGAFISYDSSVRNCLIEGNEFEDMVAASAFGISRIIYGGSFTADTQSYTTTSLKISNNIIRCATNCIYLYGDEEVEICGNTFENWKDNAQHPENNVAIRSGDGNISYRFDNVYDNEFLGVNNSLLYEKYKFNNRFSSKEGTKLGLSAQILSSNTIEDSTPYISRSFVDIGAGAVGGYEEDSILGYTLNWHQYSGISGYTFLNVSLDNENSLDNHIILSVTNISSGATVWYAYTKVAPIINHIYLYGGTVTNETEGMDSRAYFGFMKGSGSMSSLITTNDDPNKKTITGTRIFKITESSNFVLRFGSTRPNLNDTASFDNIQIFDLTQLFGQTLAEQLLAMENNTLGSGVALFKQFFSNEYYNYSLKTLIPTQIKAHKFTKTTTGENNIYLFNPIASLNGMIEVDGNNNWVPSSLNDEYKSDGTIIKRWGVLDFSTVNDSDWIQDGSVPSFYLRNTSTYAPNIKYVGLILPFSKYTPVQIAGNAGNFYNNSPDFAMGITNSQATPILRVKDTTHESNITSFITYIKSTKIIYELETPITEQGEYQNPQLIDGFDTEEYVFENSVLLPVFHNSTYHLNCRSEAETLANTSSINNWHGATYEEKLRDFLMNATSGNKLDLRGQKITITERFIKTNPTDLYDTVISNGVFEIPESIGGWLYIRADGNYRVPIFNNCVFTGGGAIFVNRSFNFKAIGCSFYDVQIIGPGVEAEGIDTTDSFVQACSLVGCNIMNKTKYFIECNNAQHLTISDCAFEAGNYGVFKGIGREVNGTLRSSLVHCTLNNCIFEGIQKTSSEENYRKVFETSGIDNLDINGCYFEANDFIIYDTPNGDTTNTFYVKINGGYIQTCGEAISDETNAPTYAIYTTSTDRRLIVNNVDYKNGGINTHYLTNVENKLNQIVTGSNSYWSLYGTPSETIKNTWNHLFDTQNSTYSFYLLPDDLVARPAAFYVTKVVPGANNTFDSEVSLLTLTKGLNNAYVVNEVRLNNVELPDQITWTAAIENSLLKITGTFGGSSGSVGISIINIGSAMSGIIEER